MVPPGEGNEARGDGRRGVGVSHSTAEAGELSPRDPVEGRGHRQGGTVGGKDGQHTEVGSRLHVTTTDSRTGQTSLRDGGGHRLASWTSWYATARTSCLSRSRMRQNPHVRICGGPGSATTLVYPTQRGYDVGDAASHSSSFDQRRRPETFFTAMAAAFFWPASTTSRLPRVMPV